MVLTSQSSLFHTTLKWQCGGAQARYKESHNLWRRENSCCLTETYVHRPCHSFHLSKRLAVWVRSLYHKFSRLEIKTLSPWSFSWHRYCLPFQYYSTVNLHTIETAFKVNTEGGHCSCKIQLFAWRLDFILRNQYLLWGSLKHVSHGWRMQDDDLVSSSQGIVFKTFTETISRMLKIRNVIICHIVLFQCCYHRPFSIIQELN